MLASVECDMRTIYICTPTVPKRQNIRSSRCVVRLESDRLQFYLIATSATQTRAEKFRYNISENAVQVNEVPSEEGATAKASISVRFDASTVVNIFLENPTFNLQCT